MKNKKILLVLIVILFFALVGGVLYFFLLQKDIDVVRVASKKIKQSIGKSEDKNSVPSLPDLDVKKINVNDGNEEKKITKDLPKPKQEKKSNLSEKELLIKKALSFADKFGTYSNQSDFGNLKDLKPLMTEQMQNWVDGQKNNFSTEKYYGIITKAVSAEFQDFDDSNNVVKILLKTRRKEFLEDAGEQEVFNQDLILTFKKTNKEWKVDSAFWVEK